MNTIWRATVLSFDTSVNAAIAIPIPTAATKARISVARSAVLPSVNNQGNSGSTAPNEKVASDATAAEVGEPSSSGWKPISSIT